MPATDKQTGIPAPSPWLTLTLAVLVQVIGLAFYFGRNDNRLTALETFKANVERKEEAARAALEQRYQAAEAARNAEKDKAVADLVNTGVELKAELDKIRRTKQP